MFPYAIIFEYYQTQSFRYITVFKMTTALPTHGALLATFHWLHLRNTFATHLSLCFVIAVPGSRRILTPFHFRGRVSLAGVLVCWFSLTTSIAASIIRGSTLPIARMLLAHLVALIIPLGGGHTGSQFTVCCQQNWVALDPLTILTFRGRGQGGGKFRRSGVFRLLHLNPSLSFVHSQ
jgi:hypothetical protein